MVLIVVMTAQMGRHDDPTQDGYVASLPPQQDTIRHNKICMVDDIYQGDYPTLPLTLNARTYYATLGHHWPLDPIFGGDGYPMLFQTGESYNGKPCRQTAPARSLLRAIGRLYTIINKRVRCVG
jgi:hypothetical protein